MKVILPIIVIVVAIAGFVLFLNTAGPKEQQAAGDVFDLNFKDYDGNQVSLSDVQGKPLVVNSWAVWCPFCKKELADFATVQDELGNRVTIIAIDRAESLNVAKKFTDEKGVTDRLIFWLDLSDSFYKKIGGFSMPETIFINSDGETVFHKRGPMDVEEIKEHIQKIL